LEDAVKTTYKGKAGALTSAETKKIETKFSKLAKLLDARKGEREAHVMLSQERHLNHAEITVRYQEHDLVGIGAAADTYTAIGVAIEKLERQILRLRERVRDSHREPKQEKTAEGAPAAAAAAAPPASESEAEPAAEPRVFRSNHHEHRP
jgi:ribosomal subunit interface protein